MLTAPLALVAPTAPLAALAPELASAHGYAAASRAANTRRAYAADVAAFASWCAAKGLCSLPAEGPTVALYIASLADEGLAVATIARALVAINQAHKLAGHEGPRAHRAVRETFAGIRRTIGTAQRGKAPMTPEAIRKAAVGRDDVLGARDRALLAVGFAGGFRRSEIVSLDVSDLDFRAEGVVVMLRRSKTDQEGAGRRVALPYGSNPDTCPVRALRAWLDAASIEAGAVFRAVDRHRNVGTGRLSDRSVANIVKSAAERAGLDVASYSGHSLRAGLATAAAKAGKSERAIMRQTGHRSERMVRRYIREASLFDDNAAGGIGL
jgi:site-specific recombinase XerD